MTVGIDKIDLLAGMLDLRFDLLSRLEFVSNGLGEDLVQHVSCRHLRPYACVWISVNKGLSVAGSHFTKDHVKILRIWTEARVATPALFHDL